MRYSLSSESPLHFKIPNTKLTPGTLEDVRDEGLWLGFNMRSVEHFIGTNVGVFRVATVRRKPEDARWSATRVNEKQGCPKQPVPGQSNRRSPACSRKFEIKPTGDEQFVPQPPAMAQTRTWKIYKHDIELHGPTE